MNESKPIRWLPGITIFLLGMLVAATFRIFDIWPYEQFRIVGLLMTGIITALLLLIWWLFFSRASTSARLAVLVLASVPFVVFRLRGMTGDFIPIIELRFGKGKAAAPAGGGKSNAAQRADYPQFLGPNRDGHIPDIALAPDWKSRPPEVLWRQPVGAAWSGFAIVGDRAVTMEQDGEDEAVTCRDIFTGVIQWSAKSPGHYNTAIAGEGPRATPTIRDGRVYSLGATGALRCVELDSGKPLWSRDLMKDTGVELPEWGFASSPLVHGGLVVVSAGCKTADGKPVADAPAASLLAYDAATGAPVWKGGTRPINYSSPFLLTLAGREQIVMFNTEAITAHDPATGAVLWEHPWGKGMPVVSRPIPVGGNRVFFSSGYGIGGALLEIAPGADGRLAATEVWKTSRFQAKFSNPAERGGFVYGVSDGIFACLDLRDGTVKWKDGRHGHGQGLLVGELYLQMTEAPGELVLLRPTPEGANKLGRTRIFDEKTWNPIALSGDLLLVRNDREAACIRLPLAR